MDINWNVRRTGGLMISSYAFAEQAKLAAGIRETGTVSFLVRHATKTSLDIEVSCPAADGRHNFAVAYIPKGTEMYKFHTQATRNVFTCEVTQRHRFKLTKTQGLPELKHYLSLVIRDLVPDLGAVEAEIVLYNMPEFDA